MFRISNLTLSWTIFSVWCANWNLQLRFSPVKEWLLQMKPWRKKRKEKNSLGAEKYALIKCYSFSPMVFLKKGSTADKSLGIKTLKMKVWQSKSKSATTRCWRWQSPTLCLTRSEKQLHLTWQASKCLSPYQKTTLPLLYHYRWLAAILCRCPVESLHMKSR